MCRWLSFFALSLLLFLQTAQAQPAIKFDEDQINTPLGESIELYTDSTGQLSLAQVMKGNRFQRSGQAVLNLGISTHYHWLRFRVTNATDERDLLLNLDQPVLNEAQVYVVDSKGKVRKKEINTAGPYSERKYKHQNMLFDLGIAQGQTATVYVRLMAREQLTLPVRIGVRRNILEQLMERDFLCGLYYGLILVMFLYNLFVYISLRDPLYLYYVAYVLILGLTQASLQGYGFRFLWPNNPSLEYYSVFVAGATSGLASMIFIRKFLNLRQAAPNMFKVFMGVEAGYYLSLLLLAFGNTTASHQVIDLCALAGSVSIYTAAVQARRQGNRQANFILIAWTLFLASVIIFVLKNFGLVPYNQFTYYVLQIGSGFEMVLLSFALANRINILKREKEQSQAEALRISQENERIIREQNVVLEAKVKERTAELQVSNSSLEEALHTLKEAQTQLVDAEKMASLGQLTAGIAHEINNPINFVISNINPLKRDIGDIRKVLDAYDSALANPSEDAVKGVKRLKEDLELDYIMKEVDQLLSGIDEGASRTSAIVRGLRNFSRLDESDIKKVPLTECLDSTLILLNSQLKGTIDVVKDYEDIEKVECYAGKINQLLMNILTNSIQAIEAVGQPAGYRGKVNVWLRRAGDHAEIGIADNGVGMTNEVKNRIFEPFFSTKDVGKGTGLGMSIVYSIIKKHDGHIDIDTAPGQGTTMRIYIPFLAKTQQVKEIKIVA